MLRYRDGNLSAFWRIKFKIGLGSGYGVFLLHPTKDVFPALSPRTSREKSVSLQLQFGILTRLESSGPVTSLFSPPPAGGGRLNMLHQAQVVVCARPSVTKDILKGKCPSSLAMLVHLRRKKTITLHRNKFVRHHVYVCFLQSTLAVVPQGAKR
jgi:hypothetical protein